MNKWAGRSAFLTFLVCSLEIFFDLLGNKILQRQAIHPRAFWAKTQETTKQLADFARQRNVKSTMSPETFLLKHRQHILTA